MSDYIERKEKLISQIEKAKNQIERLKNKRIQEIGQLAMSCGLADIDNSILEKNFALLAKQSQVLTDE